MEPSHNTVVAIVFVFLAIAGPTVGAQESHLSVTMHSEPPASLRDERMLTLADCFALALKQSETIAIRQEVLKETEGRFLQALSGALPRASFEASEKRQDGSGGSAFTLKRIPERKFVFSQPLFSGFKEFAAMAGARAERRQRRYEKARAEQLLFVDVSDAFYLLREQREDFGTLEMTRTVLLQRIEELSDRQRLGRSRPSEVVSVEAQLRRSEAEMELARSKETTARQLLEFLTGLSHIEGVVEPEVSLPVLASEGDYLGKAALRPDVRAAEEALRVAGKTVTATRADFWPDVDAEGNVYTKRAGVAEDVTWDVLFKVNVPLFQGGKTLGAVREAQSRARQAKLRYEETQREALLDIRNLYAKLRAETMRNDALEKALAASEEDYRLQTEDYRLSLINNLDVLKALEVLQDARRDVIKSTYEVKRLFRQLQAATGETL